MKLYYKKCRLCTRWLKHLNVLNSAPDIAIGVHDCFANFYIVKLDNVSYTEEGKRVWSYKICNTQYNKITYNEFRI